MEGKGETPNNFPCLRHCFGEVLWSDHAKRTRGRHLHLTAKNTRHTVVQKSLARAHIFYTKCYYLLNSELKSLD